jgi:ABC-type Zn uptake system ZnuABC Zn-binding protein ZnuA
MIRRRALVLGAVTALLPGGAHPSESKPRVVATTVIIAAMAKEVGGDLVELRGLVPAGADPHEFEPQASDLRAVERAALILRHGLQYDDWLTRTLSAGSRAKIVTTTNGIRPYKIREDGKLVADPHVWHDPEHAKRMVENITAGLASVAPAYRVGSSTRNCSSRPSTAWAPGRWVSRCSGSMSCSCSSSR